jgi:hypothetical protein
MDYEIYRSSAIIAAITGSRVLGVFAEVWKHMFWMTVSSQHLALKTVPLKTYS